MDRDCSSIYKYLTFCKKGSLIMLHQGNRGCLKYAPSPLLLCTVLARDSVCKTTLVNFAAGSNFLLKA